MNILEKKILSIKNELDYDSGASPLYIQLAELIKLIIKTGSHESGEKLPSERVMAEYFGVSRVTIRKTFDELLVDNYVYKHQGKGIFVSKQYHPKLPKLHVGLLFITNNVYEFHPMNIQYFEGINSVFSQYEYTTEIITTEAKINPTEFRKLINQKKINAIISFIAEQKINNEIHDLLFDMPFISRMSEYKTAYIDYKKVIDELFMFLYQNGHRNIALNFAIRGMESTDIILKEYNELCQKYSLTPYEFEVGQFTMEYGKRIIKEIVKNKEITAVLAADDFIAQGMVRGLYDLNKSCPKDISIVGIGDYDFANYIVPPLTTMKLPYYDIGVRLAYSIVGKEQKTYPKPYLVKRDSVKKI